MTMREHIQQLAERVDGMELRQRIMLLVIAALLTLISMINYIYAARDTIRNSG